MESIAIIILAAGKGTRMGGDSPKVLAETCENTLINHVLTYSRELQAEKTVVVTGYQREKVEESVESTYEYFDPNKIVFAVQESQNGTGDAVKSALPHLHDFKGTVVILYGDVPLIKDSTLADLVAMHEEQKATVTLISLKGDVSNAYGRIIRDDSGHIQKITELKDCTTAEKFIDETNSGIYAVDSAFLEPAIDSLTNDNAQSEYYLTDIVEKAASEGQTLASIAVFDDEEIQGVNTKADLMRVNKTLRERKVEKLLTAGVLIEDPDSLFVDGSVEIEAGAQIGPNVILKGQTKIAADAVIEGSAYLVDTTVAKGALIRFGVRAESAVIGSGAKAGPFAHLRTGTILHDNVAIGNFVETKKAILHKGVKAGHLSYLGDCEIQSDVNIGAGVITANYDGANKHKTSIGEGVFVGSNSTLIAPIEVGDKAFVGAGSTVSKNVPEETLVITRAKRKEIPGWKKPVKK